MQFTTFISADRAGALLMSLAKNVTTLGSKRERLREGRTLVRALSATGALSSGAVIAIGLGTNEAGDLGIIVSQEITNAGN